MSAMRLGSVEGTARAGRAREGSVGCRPCDSGASREQPVHACGRAREGSVGWWGSAVRLGSAGGAARACMWDAGEWWGDEARLCEMRELVEGGPCAADDGPGISSGGNWGCACACARGGSSGTGAVMG
jgi:hypothetical protein